MDIVMDDFLIHKPSVHLQTLYVTVSNPLDYKNRATDGSQLSIHSLTHITEDTFILIVLQL